MRIVSAARLYSFVLRSSRSTMSTSSTTTSTPTPTLRGLSIQSHTVHGYVGNKAATFPLQCLGVNVDAINTVSLSNHPGYVNGCKGKSLAAGDVEQLMGGLEANELLGYDLILTGYTSSLDVGRETEAAVKRVLAASSQAMYVLDPVLGDDGRFYVPQVLTEFFKNSLMPLATVITPNQFEAEILSGINITTFETAKEACNVLHSYGPKICILKGLHLRHDADLKGFAADDAPGTSTGSGDELSIVASIRRDNGSQQVLRLNLPKLAGKFSGCGDLFTALCGGLLLRILRSKSSSGAILDTSSNSRSENTETDVAGTRLGSTSSSSGSRDRHQHQIHRLTVPELAQVIEGVKEVMCAVIEKTQSSGSRELHIVESMEAYLTAKAKMDEIISSTSVRESAYIAHASTPLAPVVSNVPTIGIIFDMDGTLTEPGAIDFSEMYRRTGFVAGTGDLVSMVNAVTDSVRRQELEEIIVEEEMKGCDRMILRPDLHTFFAALRKHRIRTALATRNCYLAYERFAKNAGFPEQQFSPALARESLQDRVNKPDKRVAQHVLHTWDISADQSQVVWFVGDSDDDMKCGKAAGCRTCLILNPSYRSQQLAENKELVDLAVPSLTEFGRHLGIFE